MTMEINQTLQGSGIIELMTDTMLTNVSLDLPTLLVENELESATINEDTTESLNWTSSNRKCAFDIRALNLSKYNYAYRRSMWREIGTQEALKISLYAIVFLVALIGNSLVILVVYFNTHMRTSTNQYLVNLAAADLLVTLCCTWVHLVRHLSHPNYVLSSSICKMEGFINATTLTASVLTLTVISVGRFIAVLFPLHAHTSPNHAHRVIIGIWTVSALFALPTIPYREKYRLQWLDFTQWQCDEFWPQSGHFDARRNTCVVTFDSKKIFYSLFNLLLYFIPVSIMIVSYALVVWRLWATPLPGEQGDRARNVATRSKKKVVKMVTVVLLAFVICWTPLQSLILYSSFVHKGQGELPEWFSMMEYLAYFIAHTNSALNPILYCSFNASFREGLKCLLHCRSSSRGRLHSRHSPWKGLTVKTKDTTFFGFSAEGTQPPLQMKPIENKLRQVSSFGPEADENQTSSKDINLPVVDSMNI